MNDWTHNLLPQDEQERLKQAAATKSGRMMAVYCAMLWCVQTYPQLFHEDAMQAAPWVQGAARQ